MLASPAGYDRVAAAATPAFSTWREVPAPKRGELVRDLGRGAARAMKEPLGDLVALEMGKIRAEGHGEVQEMIDICDFAIGLSRQLYGLTIASERPGHRMMEQWHPLGPWASSPRSTSPSRCGRGTRRSPRCAATPVIWKPAEPTPLTAVAVQHIANRVMADHGADRRLHAGRRLGPDHRRGDAARPAAAADLVHRLDGDRPARRADRGRTLRPDDPRTRRQQRHRRRGRRQPRYGGAGHRLRRGRHRRPALHLDAPHHRASLDRRRPDRAAGAAPTAQVRIGDPLDGGHADGAARHAAGRRPDAGRARRRPGPRAARSSTAAAAGPTSVRSSSSRPSSGCRRRPTSCGRRPSRRFSTCSNTTSSTRRSRCTTACRRGCRARSSPKACATAEEFLSARGSDCGIANVNIGTSGAEIGGAFGGEKETGGGRESGSDAWKSLHAPPDQHGQLVHRAAAGAGNHVRGVKSERY